LGVPFAVHATGPIGREKAHDNTDQDQEVIVVVVGRLLHQVGPRPQEGKGDHAQAVPVSNGHQNPHQAHQYVIEIHAISGKGLQPLEADKGKGELGFNKGAPNPSGEDGAETLQADQDSKEYTEDNQGTVVHAGEEQPGNHVF
jgi:hypothetical protein